MDKHSSGRVQVAAKDDADALPAPVTLTFEQLASVAGGINPQPLPPRVEE